ncbi:putative actin patch assembly and actin polymerization protein [Didymella heteroderae]|uniref:Actin patch assembly and actin polymerization protein n=1 Tax=Didymella heteroderae TaxID=1769908 RepID=A0A9P5C3C9_9PLEO|nr:putative actin patch assembly and actin polymerization protein [Didymella heteroderae]
MPIDRLTSEQYEENDIGGVVDLIEVIRIQSTGPTEAARALRKKLKYGDAHRQIRALVILDALIQNAGSRILARDETADVDVRKRVNVLFRQWAVAYKGTPGLERIAALHKELPRKSRPQPQQSRIIREQDAEAAREREEHSPPPVPQPRRPDPPPTSSSSSRPVTLGSTSSGGSSLFSRSKKDKKTPKGQKFNLEREKGQMLETMASANVASANLLNGLQLINREQQRVSDNPEVMKRFETCKQHRRQILRYIHLVESEQYIGGLLNANDELVKALMAFEIMDKSIDDDDSDSEDESDMAQAKLASLKMQEETPPAKPPRPMSIPMPPAVPAIGKQRADPESEPEEDDDDDDPFGDSNAVATPWAEKKEPSWRDHYLA